MADDERDPQLARWLEVEPLDDLTRRRLVTRALHESGADSPKGSGRWRGRGRWLAVAAAVAVVLVVGLSLLATSGGDDGEQASPPAKSRATALAPESFAAALSAAPDVGDYGNLDQPANRAALRKALERPLQAGAPAAAAPNARDAAGASAPSAPAGCARGAVGTILARGRGTLEGRPVTVVLLEGSNGARSIEALFDGACDGRRLQAPSR